MKQYCITYMEALVPTAKATLPALPKLFKEFSWLTLCIVFHYCCHFNRKKWFAFVKYENIYDICPTPLPTFEVVPPLNLLYVYFQALFLHRK